MNQLINECIANIDVSALERLYQFNDWYDQKMQRLTAQKLTEQKLDYMPSPEDILEAEERRKLAVKLCRIIEDKVGTRDMYLLYQFYVERRNAIELSKEFNIDRCSVYRKIRRIKKRALRALEDYMAVAREILPVDEWSTNIKGSNFPMFQYEFEMYRPTTPYKYKGKVHLHTKCQVINYLKQAFGDSETKCPICFTRTGTNQCRCKTIN